MKFFLIFILSTLLVSASTAQTWKVSPDGSKVEFKIKNAGITVDGNFSGVVATVVFDPDDLLHSSIKGTIQTNTIRTGIKLRDNHLKGEDYFNTGKYSLMHFTSKKINSKGNGNYLVTGDLKIKDKTQEVSIPFTFQESGATGIFKASFTLNRRDYGVGGSSWTLSDQVTISLSIAATK